MCRLFRTTVSREGVHRFEEFTGDLTVWVMFYGPEGGEARPSADSRHE